MDLIKSSVLFIFIGFDEVESKMYSCVVLNQARILFKFKINKDFFSLKLWTDPLQSLFYFFL